MPQSHLLLQLYFLLFFLTRSISGNVITLYVLNKTHVGSMNIGSTHVSTQGKDAFTRSDLNSIAEKLDVDDPNRGGWNPVSIVFRPHHNEITGNYDINVLIAALEQKDKTVVWHDKRNGVSSIDLDGTDDRLMGIILNVPVRKFSGLWKSRHWFTLRCIQGVWYNLDSDFAVPYAFKDTEEVKEFLDGIITAGAEVLLIMNDKQ